MASRQYNPTFRQIATFWLQELEVSGIAAGGSSGIRGIDPIINSQLTADEIKKCEANEELDLQLYKNPAAVGEKSQRTQIHPSFKKQDKPAAIAWLVKSSEITDGQISRLIGTKKYDKGYKRKNSLEYKLYANDPVILGW